MPRRRGRGRGGRGLARAVHRIERPVHRREFIGSTVDPGLHPREHVISPWVDIVCELGGKGDKTFSPNLIANIARKQHGYVAGESNVDIDIRFRGYYLWTLSASRPVSMNVFDLHRSDEAQDLLKVLTDWPAYNQFARVGYWLPLNMTRITFDDTNVTKKIVGVDTSADIYWLMHVYMSIRPSKIEHVSVSRRRVFDDMDSSFSALTLSPSGF